MKKVIQIIIGLIALGFLIVIIKNNFFISADTKSYEEGWDAYEKNQFEMAIFNFNHVDKNKHPDVWVGLGSAYLKTGDYNNAIQHLQKAYSLNYKKGTEDYSKLLVSLGMSYLYAGDPEKAKFYLEKARSLGYDTSVNFKILDSVKQNSFRSK
ncbi:MULTISPECIES: tetratricopeptide repeat protein [Chryseobacterium]|uniref:Tetratricopeptide (TPR) repeat protein n=1 Tax=Chryseobacterium camelliae TaxID=1265445 RepID=A0ABU0TJI7_9FLAO|nr:MULTISPECIES: tetratricopeptide repeat protein [Chryseobacterium]MDT3408929.1 tetratricopeptide (TPR) repeat protein [Pseudacidovorax intermedius]MDQ1097215.1 tetratricopeptide (TPR) repeat protein [Chryseobacterium camelliae]MDQ1101150.1 tetratricopeptide (TPR) repeat protein [Chryseobacterium sp. SORGH_AS_1048]MDR6084595.1 tetratricopeptide (TPR) repeat protein [Chryseobacterium sp. SORGH_AS_0909]MDR6132867.1 tetratricopeptide (TPR) repeat protein [Chryseobacterium sp. SORGH_AS_1175]